MAKEDIEKLKEKVSKDPNSKLFVPLAEEYKKRGMIDEAVSVLAEGLNNQPGYMSARVALGKIYLEKNMTAEAKEEFEKVVSAVHDNLFAHKKLAGIYRADGDKEKAVAAYKTVLKLNPFDEDAVSNLEDLQSSDRSAALRGVEERKESAEHVFGQTAGLEADAHAAGTEAKESLETEDVEMVFSQKEIHSAHEDEIDKLGQSITGRAEEIRETAEEDIDEDDIPEEEVVGEAAISEDEIQEAEKEILSYVDSAVFVDAESPSFESPPVLDSTLRGEKEAENEKPLIEKDKPVSAPYDAESFIASGNYFKAMAIYKKMLSANPGDKHLLQKVEELKMLLKMLGKEDDMIISRLEAFGEGIRKRKDEFFASP